jgi:endonuclease YncB( thermonuclease family)
MRDLNQIIKEINALSTEEKVAVYPHIYESLDRKEQILAALERFRGKGKGIWNEDAQEYVNRLRADD